jgi:hypothetical protein
VCAVTRQQAGSRTWYWVVRFLRAGKRYCRRFYERNWGGPARRTAPDPCRGAGLARPVSRGPGVSLSDRTSP